jgi:hypothetical protein
MENNSTNSQTEIVKTPKQFAIDELMKLEKQYPCLRSFYVEELPDEATARLVATALFLTLQDAEDLLSDMIFDVWDKGNRIIDGMKGRE